MNTTSNSITPQGGCMQDYQQLYRRELRRNCILREKLKRVRKLLCAGLPKTVTLLAIFMVTRIKAA